MFEKYDFGINNLFKMKLTKTMLEEIAGEVGPLVEEETHWDLKLSTLKIEPIDEKDYVDRVYIPEAEWMGLTLDSVRKDSLFRRIKSYFEGKKVTGVYEPGSDFIYLFNNISVNRNYSQLYTIIGHELTHRGQFLTYPAFVDELRQYFATYYSSELLSYEWKQSLEKLIPMNTLIEGDATLIENLLALSNYPDAKKTLSFSSELYTIVASLLVRFDRADVSKIKEKFYSDGYSLMRQLNNYLDGRDKINNLYSLNSADLKEELEQINKDVAVKFFTE